MSEEFKRVRVRFKPAKDDARRGYDVLIKAGALVHLGEAVSQITNLQSPARRILIISNRRVFDLYGAQAMKSLRAAEFRVHHFLMGDGERFKTLQTAERALAYLSASEFERSDTVVALGGGVVGDLAGFVAATFMRGINFIQVPTTLLAQIDASVGGKTAVNTNAGKNLVGAFHQPRLVLIDTDTLQTLPAREMRAGWCEAIKHGAIGSRSLFNQTERFITQYQHKKDVQNERLARLIKAHCSFKARIVAGDERERLTRNDARSRLILNFGHTVGHALERITDFKRFRHGEAVGLGMLVAGEISVRTERLNMLESERLRAAIQSAAHSFPRTDDLSPREIMSAIKKDKKSRGGHVQWILLERIGRALVVSDQMIAPEIVRSSLRAVLRRKHQS
jgi:3-dehydroquinate synthase